MSDTTASSDPTRLPRKQRRSLSPNPPRHHRHSSSSLDRRRDQQSRPTNGRQQQQQDNDAKPSKDRQPSPSASLRWQRHPRLPSSASAGTLTCLGNLSLGEPRLIPAARLLHRCQEMKEQKQQQQQQADLPGPQPDKSPREGGDPDTSTYSSLGSLPSDFDEMCNNN